MDFRCASEILSGWSNVPRQKGAVRYPTFRMLIFCTCQEKLAGIAGDRRGLIRTEIVGVLGKILFLLAAASPFHAGDRGSNPLGDAKEIQRVRVHSLALLRCLVALFRKQVHGSPQVAVDILNVPLRCSDILVA
jgi:hypothetical protein